MLQNNPQLKSLIDRLWDKLWSGGISKLTNIEAEIMSGIKELKGMQNGAE